MFTCVRYRNTSIIVGLFAILLGVGGCATKQATTSQSTEAEPQTTSQKTPIAAELAVPPMSEVIELFIQHPHTVFQLATQSHSMYVGGELTAQFDEQKEQLNIVADDESLTCQYSRAGNLTPPHADAKKKAIKIHHKKCETLVKTLYNALNE
ncbi:MAG: hypothetical protein GXP14_13265 [Gammaproteobacteria bacterium]|nr:hypothetical protein [Gammaproteobacteria bacterium]